MMGSKSPDEERLRYWRRRELLDRVKFGAWLLFEAIKDFGPGGFRF